MTAPTISRSGQGPDDTQATTATAGTDHLPTTMRAAMPNPGPSSAGQDSRTGQGISGGQGATAGAGTDTAATNAYSAPIKNTSLPPHFPADHHRSDAQSAHVGGDQTGPGDGQGRTDSQLFDAASGPSSSATPARDESAPNHVSPGVADPQTGSAERCQSASDDQRLRAALADPTLATLAAVVDDLEETRKANANRLGHLTRSGADVDGVERGLGLPEDHDAVKRMTDVNNGIAEMEHKAVLNTKRAMRQPALHNWYKTQNGVGDKQIARLLAIIGDPYWNVTDDEPRTVSQLWQYCGHGDPARSKKKKGQRVQHAPEAKMRVWNIAASLLKAGIRDKEPVTEW